MLALFQHAVSSLADGSTCDAWPEPASLAAPANNPRSVAAFWKELADWLRTHPRGTVLSMRPLIVEFEDFIDDDFIDSLRDLYVSERKRLSAKHERSGNMEWCFSRAFEGEMQLRAANQRKPYAAYDIPAQLRETGRFAFNDDELIWDKEALCFDAARYHELDRLLPSSSYLMFPVLKPQPASQRSLPQAVDRAIERKLGIPAQRFADTGALLHYTTGAGYGRHEDCVQVPPGAPIGWHNDRMLTLIIYLNSLAPGVDGGETHFPMLGLNVTPARGKAVVMFNLDVDAPEAPGRRPLCLRETEHESIPVVHGSKLVWQQWFRWRGPSRTDPRASERAGHGFQPMQAICDSTGSCRQYIREGPRTPR